MNGAIQKQKLNGNVYDKQWKMNKKRTHTHTRTQSNAIATMGFMCMHTNACE